MSDNNKENGILASDQTEEQSDNYIRSHHDVTLMNQCPPMLHQLNIERTYIDKNHRKIRQWTYGRRDINKKNKVILMVGETGSGKTTIINTMTNYLLGVNFEDEEFCQITEETEHIQPPAVTVYEVFVEKNPTSLTIIDTPGYGHTDGYEKDAEVAEYLGRLFSDEDGIQYIDAVCFVMKASQNRLSGKEHYIFHSVLSLFGRDIENNIVFLLTHSDGRRPTDALNAINTSEIPCRRNGDKVPVHFLFNNHQKKNRDKEHVHLDRSAWEMGERSMNEFFTLLEENNRKSVEMTLDVLKERRRLEACVSNLMERITEKELKIKELTENQEALRLNRDMIQKCENFKFTVNKVNKEKKTNDNQWWWNRNVMCCNVCKENCHEWGCWWVNDLSLCSVMKNNYCTECTGKCHYMEHVKEDKKFVLKKEEVKMSFGVLKKEYEQIGDQNLTDSDKKKYEDIKTEHETILKECEKQTELQEKLNSDLKYIKQEKTNMLYEAYISIMILSKIALKPDSVFTLQHLDLLIPRLKEEGKDEWVKNLEDLRKTGEKIKNKQALRHLLDFADSLICL